LQGDRVGSQITGRAMIMASDRVKEYKSLIEGAASDKEPATLDFMTDRLGPSETVRVLDSISQAMSKNPNLKVRYMTDVQDQNIKHVKEILAAGIEIRHVEGIDKNVAITRTRFVQTIHTFEMVLPNELLISSDDQDVITLLSSVFQALWDTKITAERRIREIEERAEIGETKLIREPTLITQYTKRFLLESRNEVRLVLPSVQTSMGDAIYFEDYYNRIVNPQSGVQAADNDVLPKLRVLIPSSDSRRTFESSPCANIECREITATHMGIGIYDDDKVLIVQLKTHSAEHPGGSLGSAILTTNKQTVQGFAFIFDELWRESELVKTERTARSREARASREARLLQDILAHDIRNFNQVARLNGELLANEAKDVPKIGPFTNSLLSAIDGSSQLIERARRLGKLLSDQAPFLYEVDLLDSIEHAFVLVQKAYPKKRIEKSIIVSDSQTGDGSGRGRAVLADDFLQEVFANLFTNSVNYTEGDDVHIQITLDERAMQGRETRADVSPIGPIEPDEGRVSTDRETFCVATVNDRGMGITDEMKSRIFSRYLEGARGSGLGMSIVHALVVERYNGRMLIGDRVKGDYTKGVSISVCLRKPSGSATG
jgi:signal transduction histidine kinase